MPTLNERNMAMGRNSTITEYISDYNSEELQSSAFFLKQVLDIKTNKKIIVNFNNLILKYMPELKDLKQKIELSDTEYAKYKYNPKLLSFDLYGTTELWFMILELNELYSVTQFDSKTIYLFKSNIVDKMIRILNLETEVKNYNEEEISELLANSTI